MTAKVDILGCPVDAIDAPTALEAIAAAMRTKTRLCPSLVNTAKLVRMRQDPELRRDVLAGDLILADGAGVILAGRLMGRPLPERIAGIDLMLAVVECAAREGFRPYLLGARPAVVEHAAQRLVAANLGLELAGWRDGYFAPEDEAGIVAAINASGADCLFVALPTPMKERFLFRNRIRLDPAVIMGVGGSLDVISGQIARAPSWAQRAGLEWAFRLSQEPVRMGWRYAVTNAIFAAWLGIALGARIAGQPFRPIARF